MSNLTKKSRVGIAVTTFALLSGVAGCVDSDTETVELETIPSPITTLELDDGSRLDFYEPTAGHLVLFTTADLPETVDRLSPLAIYEEMSGQVAPAMLREAQSRADLAARNRSPDSAPVDEAAIVPPSHAAKNGQRNLTASDFATSYCNPGVVDFDYCWTNSTNNYSIDITSVDWIHAHANAYSGQMTMSMYYKKTFGGWGLMFSDTVTGAATVVTQTTTNNDTYRVELTNASGDSYHLSIHGDK